MSAPRANLRRTGVAALVLAAALLPAHAASEPETAPGPQTAPLSRGPHVARSPRAPQSAPTPQTAPSPQSAPAGTPTHETTDFRLTLSRGGRDLFTLHARRSTTFGTSYTDLEGVTLTGRAGPVPGLVVKARRGRFHPASGDFTLEGSVTAGRPGELEARVEHLGYRASEGVATSDDAVELSGRRLRGSARGLELSPSEQRLTLLSEVVLKSPVEVPPERALDLHCGKLQYVASPPNVDCLDGVRASAGERTLEARLLHLDLRESDRHPLSGRVEGDARLRLLLEPAPEGGSAAGIPGFPSGSEITVKGERLELDFDPDRGALRSLTEPAGGAIEARPLGGGDEFRTLTGGWLRIGLRPEAGAEGSLFDTLEARGEAHLSWKDAAGPGDLRAGALSARWSPGSATLESAHLEGGWRLERPDLRGTGAEADVHAKSVELRGNAEGYATLERGGRLLAGARLELPRGEGAWSGEGGVQARHSAEAGGGSWSPLGADGVFWVTARRFEVDPSTWLWRFEDSVQAWQESNLIESDRLDVNETARTLAARGHVVSRGSSGGHEGGAGADLVWVRAPQLDYAEGTRRAEYRGGVEMIHDTSHLAARDIDVLLGGASAQVERVNARGDVHATYADALGEAERAEYLPAGRRLRLWTPGGTAHARRRDGSQALSGQELTFDGSSDRISVQSGLRGRSWVLFHDTP